MWGPKGFDVTVWAYPRATVAYYVGNSDHGQAERSARCQWCGSTFALNAADGDRYYCANGCYWPPTRKRKEVMPMSTVWTYPRATVLYVHDGDT
jgi:hypothetical protein